MQRKTICAILFALLFANVSALAIYVSSTRAWNGTVYIYADGSIDPMTAPIQQNGDVYTLTDNIISDTDGIVIERDNMTLDGKGYTIQGTYSGTGVYMISTIDVEIKNTNIEGFSVGVILLSTSQSVITGIKLMMNDVGIMLASSYYNTIFGNSIEQNGAFGIWFDSSASNEIYHNNFINNTMQVYMTYDSINMWDNTCEGNYWNDYNGSDSDNDGVGDTCIPWERVDDYPLMNLFWNPCDINHDLIIDMKDISMAARAFGTEPGYALWNPHADITGTEQLVPDGIVDMKDISYIAKNFGKEHN